MKIFLIIAIILSLSSCDKASDFMYNNFSLQKNIDMAEENHRKSMESDFILDNHPYVFPTSVERFVQNGFAYQAKSKDQSLDKDEQSLDSGEICDVYFTKDKTSFWGQVKNNSGRSSDIEELSLSYFKLKKEDLADLDFSIAGIQMDDSIEQIESKVTDKEIIKLKNDQYYMYLNGQYVVIFTIEDDKLRQVEIIPNERLADYEKN